MVIDEDRLHVLTKYATTKGVEKKSESDHNVLYAKFVLTFSRQVAEVRREVFDFKNLESQKIFF